MASLILKIDTRVEKFSIQGVAIIGRDQDCMVSIDDKQASRKHAKVYFDGQGYVIEDLNSRNGTYVNGVRAVKSELKQGDVVRVGVHTFTFSEDRADAPPPAPPEVPVPTLEPYRPVRPPTGPDAPLVLMKAFFFVLCVLIFGATVALSRTLFGWVLKMF